MHLAVEADNSGGQVVAFAYDLALGIICARQAHSANSIKIMMMTLVVSVALRRRQRALEPGGGVKHH